MVATSAGSEESAAAAEEEGEMEGKEKTVSNSVVKKLCCPSLSPAYVYRRRATLRRLPLSRTF